MRIPKSVVKKANRIFGKIAMKISKHLPEILIYGGIGLGVTSGVIACVETTKLDPVIDEAKDKIDDIHQTVAEAEDRELAVQESKKDLTKVYFQTGAKLARIYIPSVTLGALSIASILSGHNILKRRNVALAAAYTALNKTLLDYRNRVKGEVGEEKENDLFYNTTTKTIVDEDGTVTTVHEPNQDPDNYELVFGPDCPFWDRDPNYAKMTLSNVQQYATDLLDTKGYVFLNDILYELGMKPTFKGQVCGWSKWSEQGDGYVDFRAREVQMPDSDGRLVTAFILDPNVDGTILYNFTKGLTA